MSPLRTSRPSRLLSRATLVALVPAMLALSACGGSSSADTSSASGSSAASSPATVLRLGYFANLTHAPALIGVDQGLFTKELGKTTLKTQVFNAGPDEVTALFAGALDAAYIGPSPAVNAYGQSNGAAIRIIAGAASGGAELVVRDGINSAADLKGKTLASPQLGNTQDVALRTWLTSKGLKNSVTGGGDVTIKPTKNADVLDLFKSGKLDGGWLPEPYASRLVLEGKGHVLVDERDIWPGGKFPTTVLVVRTAFMKQHPDTVAALLRGHVAAVQFANKDAAAAQTSVNAGLVTAGSKKLPAATFDRAWKELTVTYDPIASALQTASDNALKSGTTDKKVDLAGIYDLKPLNAVLAALHLAPVSAAGLGTE
jgi:NitT/TauT family transport system substrate-binding protein